MLAENGCALVTPQTPREAQTFPQQASELAVKNTELLLICLTPAVASFPLRDPAAPQKEAVLNPACTTWSGAPGDAEHTT